MNHLIGDLFGPGTYGVTGNLIAWMICGIPTVIISGWHHRRQLARHIERLEQATKVKPAHQPRSPEERDPDTGRDNGDVGNHRSG